VRGKKGKGGRGEKETGKEGREGRSVLWSPKILKIDPDLMPNRCFAAHCLWSTGSL